MQAAVESRRLVDGVTIVSVEGSCSLDEDSISCAPVYDEWRIVPVFEKLARLAGHERELRVLLDMSEIVYLSSLGLGHLVSIRKKFHRSGGVFKLCCVQPFVRELLVATNLDEIFEIHPDVRTAVASFSR